MLKCEGHKTHGNFFIMKKIRTITLDEYRWFIFPEHKQEKGWYRCQLYGDSQESLRRLAVKRQAYDC